MVCILWHPFWHSARVIFFMRRSYRHQPSRKPHECCLGYFPIYTSCLLYLISLHLLHMHWFRPHYQNIPGAHAKAKYIQCRWTPLNVPCKYLVPQKIRRTKLRFFTFWMSSVRCSVVNSLQVNLDLESRSVNFATSQHCLRCLHCLIKSWNVGVKSTKRVNLAITVIGLIIFYN